MKSVSKLTMYSILAGVLMFFSIVYVSEWIGEGFAEMIYISFFILFFVLAKEKWWQKGLVIVIGIGVFLLLLVLFVP